ncbi:unnamed protein product, partial [Didymodactylos carnosus]
MSSSIDQQSIIPKNNLYIRHNDNKLNTGLSTSTISSSSTSSSSDDEYFHDASEIPESLLTCTQSSISKENIHKNMEQQPCTITLNQTQVNDLQRRDKLNFLRLQSENDDLSYSQMLKLFQQTNALNSVYSSSSLDTSTPGRYNGQTEQQQSITRKYPPDLLKDHISSSDQKRKKRQAPSASAQNGSSLSESYNMSHTKICSTNVESSTRNNSDLSLNFSPRSSTLINTHNLLIDKQHPQQQENNCCPNCYASLPSPHSQQTSRYNNYATFTNHASSLSSPTDTVSGIFLPHLVLNNIHQSNNLPLQQQHSLPVSPSDCTALPYSNRNYGGASALESRKLTSITPAVSLDTIDFITNLDELTSDSRTSNDDEIMKQPIARISDYGKYVTPQEAVPEEFINPMTMQILRTVNANANPISCSTNMNNSLRRTSIPNDYHNHHRSSISSSIVNNETSSSKVSNDELDSLSTSSDGSTKSSHAAAASTSITKAPPKAVKSLFKGSKNQLSKLVNKKWPEMHTKGKKGNGESEHEEYENEIDEDKDVILNESDVKCKSSRDLRGQTVFDKTQLLQTIVTAHNGPIWCIRFSPDGRLLATGGQDSLLKVWMFKQTHTHFDQYSNTMTDSKSKEAQTSDTLAQLFHEFDLNNRTMTTESSINSISASNENQAPLYSKPFCELIGHQAAVLDIAWSKSYFMLSSSMDKTVRLWHLSRKECLCFFRHIDFVSAIAFHPRDDRYFVSASLDGHVRLWHIPDKKVIYWNQIQAQTNSTSATNGNLITAINFCDDGKKVIVGTFDGRFIVYTDSLVYDTVMNIADKSNRSRKKRRKPRKITGIEVMNLNTSKILITSNDSRIRLYNIKTKEIERKYRGYSNNSSQIRASFSHDDRYII